MTAAELLKKQVEESGFMLTQVFEGVTEETADAKNANLMTPRETALHLCECYLMLETRVRGEEYKWGTFAPSGTTWSEIQSELFQIRGRAAEAALTKGDDQSLWRLNGIIVGHDQYHVGQMCAIRLASDPDWNAYSIYGLEE